MKDELIEYRGALMDAIQYHYGKEKEYRRRGDLETQGYHGGRAKALHQVLEDLDAIAGGNTETFKITRDYQGS